MKGRHSVALASQFFSYPISIIIILNNTYPAEQAKCVKVLQVKLDDKTTRCKSLLSEKTALQDANEELLKDKSHLEQEVSTHV